MNKPALPLEILRSFVAFVEAPNIVKAAESLGVSQPLLSKHLALLQDAVPQMVFEFEGRKKVPTRYGLALFETVKGALAGLENGLNDLNNQFASPQEARVRIGGREELLANLAPKLMFTGRVDFMPLAGAAVEEALLTKKIEIGVTQHRIDSLILVRKPFLRDSFGLVIPKVLKVRETSLGRALMEELQEKPYLSYGASDSLFNLIPKYKFEAPRIVRTFAHWPKILEMCELGLGWSLIPALYTQSVSKNVSVIPVPDSVLEATEFHLYYPKELSKMEWFRGLVSECLTLG